VSSDFLRQVKDAMILLQKEAELQEVVQLVGPDALPEKEQAILLVTKMLREDFLQQNAYSDVDARCEMDKQYEMLKTILKFHEKAIDTLDLGVQLKKVQELPVIAKVGRMKEMADVKEVQKLQKEIDSSFEGLSKG
jgi:V/A-type H+-transporting ATPase subunit A